MDIHHKLYPYPVLSIYNDDYKDSSFTMKFTAEQGLREICFKISLNLVDKKINKLIENEYAEYVIHIECPYTAYRTVIKTDETEIRKNVPEHKLNGKVSICAFVVAKDDIIDYYNDSFNDDYEGMKFDLHRGNIIAIGGQYNMKITKEVEELSKIPSIFTICKCAEDTDESMKIDIGGEKITITLCDKSFEDYKLLAGMPEMQPVIHSMLIIPALVYTFENLKNSGTGEFEDQRWYKSIERSLEKNGFVLDDKLLEDVPSFELAQKCLDLPINRALDALISHDFSDGEDE
ncbi:MAG: hypothetical protein ACI4RC_07410 [Oscillospiraceae bacterium]